MFTRSTCLAHQPTLICIIKDRSYIAHTVPISAQYMINSSTQCSTPPPGKRFGSFCLQLLSPFLSFTLLCHASTPLGSFCHRLLGCSLLGFELFKCDPLALFVSIHLHTISAVHCVASAMVYYVRQWTTCMHFGPCAEAASSSRSLLAAMQESCCSRL